MVFDVEHEVNVMKLTVKKFIFLFLFISLVLTSGFPAQSSTMLPLPGRDADLVWIESDGIRHEVFFTTLHDGKWSPPFQVTDDLFDNLHPVIDRDKEGKRWLFWTASDDGRLSLHYATFSDSEWSEIQDVPVELNSSIAPSVVVDGKGVLWLVWAGNTGGVDDIYWATLQKGKWSKARTLNQKDEVPDILPKISLTGNGTVHVVWKKFIDGSYQDIQSSWDGKKWSSPAVLKDEEMAEQDSLQNEKEMVLPVFIKDDDRAFVRLY